MSQPSQREVPRSATDHVDLVDPAIDIHRSRWFYFNSASRPFGMVNLSPDTNVKGSWNSDYSYDSLTIRCFQSCPRVADLGYRGVTDHG